MAGLASDFPTYAYDPALFWDAKAGQAKATLPAGPNGPVGKPHRRKKTMNSVRARRRSLGRRDHTSRRALIARG